MVAARLNCVVCNSKVNPGKSGPQPTCCSASCSKEFYNQRRREKYKSDSEYRTSIINRERSKRQASARTDAGRCKCCGKFFKRPAELRRKHSTTFCNEICRQAHKKKYDRVYKAPLREALRHAKCKHCDKNFIRPSRIGRQQKFCSRRCRDHEYSLKSPEVHARASTRYEAGKQLLRLAVKLSEPKTCLICSASFVGQRRHTYCSRECQQTGQRMKSDEARRRLGYTDKRAQQCRKYYQKYRDRVRAKHRAHARSPEGRAWAKAYYLKNRERILQQRRYRDKVMSADKWEQRKAYIAKWKRENRQRQAK